LGLTRFHGPIRVKQSGSTKGVEEMGNKGKLYSPEFKEEAVRLVYSSNERYPVVKIARDLDVSTETLRVSGSTKRRSMPESEMGSQQRRKKSCVAFAKR
jgi:transposase-like protein